MNLFEKIRRAARQLFTFRITMPGTPMGALAVAGTSRSAFNSG